MARLSRRLQKGNYFHVLNRASLRARLFEHDGDYRAFVAILSDAITKFEVPLLAYCVMPNHWHLVVRPPGHGTLSTFMQWLTTTHAVRWRRAHPTPGPGPVYQGRFKSIPVQPNFHLARLCRYVERNAKTAGLVDRAETWPWCSAHQRERNTEGPPLVEQIFMPENQWLTYLNETFSDLTVAQAVRLNLPFGSDDWVKAHGRNPDRRGPGRPKKMGTDPIK